MSDLDKKKIEEIEESSDKIVEETMREIYNEIDGLGNKSREQEKSESPEEEFE